MALTVLAYLKNNISFIRKFYLQHSLTSGAVFSTVGNNATFSAVLNPLPHNSTIVSVQNPRNETVFEARGTQSRYTIAGQRMIYTGNTFEGKMSFVLKNILTEDAGALIASRYLQLNFTFKTGIPSKPNIEVILQPIVNMNMVLNCKVESTTVPKNSNLSLIFNWKVNGVNISANSRFFINGSTLSITNMQRNDEGLDKSTISNKSYAVSEGNTLSANEDIISARATSVLSVNEAKEALCQMMKLPSVARSMHNITVFRLVDDKGVLQEGVDDDDRRVYSCEKSYTFIKSGSFKYFLWPTPYQYRLDCVFKI
ncbi:hypothetical protein KUTeg_014744 [Tegillarca granosa]|uniref:Ig-like domain-containing protein n=1 Tax=Tegillarca granosa TaxID=220873 RepID=A0ABQ9ERP4_TEGGR|nr:hypothetical protein KUTeg_014744 [Tegillarca granosa]